MCNSGGGFTFGDVYNLPVHIRKYYTRKLSDKIQKQNEDYVSSPLLNSIRENYIK